VKNKILVIGSGGREHAIIHQLKKSPLTEQIFCLPGNAGIQQIAQCVNNINVSNHQEVINFCQNNQIDLVVVGPEQPLVEGLVDVLQAANIKAFGPTKNAARLEGSKAFTKQICDDYNIPTAKYRAFNSPAPAIKYLDEIGIPCVIKADGIAAGKGVIIAFDQQTAITAIEEIFAGKFGNAGKTIIIEEFLEGIEVSFFAICDGKTAQFLGTAGDHKKVGEGETGLNTGGMGTYSPSPFVNEEMQNEIMQSCIYPTMQAMKDLDCPFVGILFAGLILTKNGVKLLEFNTRFGDPETQSLLPRLKTDLLQLMLDAVAGNLADKKVEFNNQSAICVVLAAKGYPEDYQKGSEIKNLVEAEKSSENLIIFHAGTKKIGDKITANGGRVLGVVALSEDIKQARIKAYKAVDLIDWHDGFCRRDIGLKVLTS
jgi:phosphoribosylamine--glycine ligase